MRITVFIVVGTSIAVGLAGCGGGAGGATAPSAAGAASAEKEAEQRRTAYPKGPVHGYTMERIDGASVSLDEYRGRTVLIVNVASECGLTPQYEQLEALYRRHRDKGLVVLGFPSNDFGGQEPGTNQQIEQFCTENYDISFPMFAKIHVVGEDQAPLYQQLSKTGGPPSWNFTKYLVGPDGRVAARFDPQTSPQSDEITKQIDDLLSS